MDPITRAIASAAAGASAAADPTYVDDVFSTFLYEGNNSTNVINNGIDLSGEGGLVWIKNRDYVFNHILVNTERGATKYLRSDSALAEQTAAQTVPSFSSTGFTTGTDNQVNYSASGQKDYVSWTFRKAAGFFDVVTYTGNGTAGRTVAHNLGSEPGMILIHQINGGHDWQVYHRSVGATKVLYLNTDDDADTDSNAWNNTAPTSSVFTVGTSNNTNQTSEEFIAYVFAHDSQSFGTDSDESIIKCGSYTGNGQVSGTAVNVGFEPQWVMIKASTASGAWQMVNTMTGMSYNSSGNGVTVGNALYANYNHAESGYGPNVIATATGFEVRNSSSYTNGNGVTYAYMAIRRPHKPPTAGTDVFKAVQTNSQPVSVGFPTDLIITAVSTKYWVPRFANARMQSSDNSDESDVSSYFKFDLQNSFSTTSWWGQSSINWYFRRAPGFFDVVAYSGNGTSGRTENHNLTVVPEMMIVKKRNGTGSGRNWQVYHSSQGNTKYSPSFRTDPFYTSSNRWNDTSPTSTQFTLGSDSDVNGSSLTYIAYLFATLDGISKVGSYSGTGSAQNIDCGFSNGARFVMIKRADTENTGSHPSRTNWYVWDSTRGIVSGDDPWLALNDANAEVTNTDYLDPLNAGFTVSSTGAGLNASGGTYIFLAIA